MDKTFITLAAAKEATAKVIAAKPDDYFYKYPVIERQFLNDDDEWVTEKTKAKECVYADPENKCGSCLVGSALFELGVPLSTLIELDDGGANPAMISEHRVVSLLHDAGYVLEEDAATYFQIAQSRQDRGEVWSSAAAGAAKEVES